MLTGVPQVEGFTWPCQPPQVPSRPAVSSLNDPRAQAAFHLVNRAGIALWTHNSPHEGGGA